MRKTYLHCSLAIIALISIVSVSCNKDNSINNVSVVATPYTLYFCDTNGALWNTNDGTYFKPSIFPSDGVYANAILAEDSTNLIWIKNSTVFLSTDNGKDFNPTYNSADPTLDQTQIIYAADEKRVYIASTTDGIGGIAYSPNKGRVNTWIGIVNNDIDPNLNTTNFHVTSYTQLKNGTLIAFDKNSNRIWHKDGLLAKWTEEIPSTINLPSGGNFTLGHFNNALVVVDRAGINGAWYSNTLGTSWYQYTGLPNRPLHVASSPFDAVLLVGTDSTGVFALQNGAFIGSNGGLTESTTVRAIANKENIFVNGLAEQFIYIATNKGIFRSQDLGQNWVLVRPGNYYAIN